MVERVDRRRRDRGKDPGWLATWRRTRQLARPLHGWAPEPPIPPPLPPGGLVNVRSRGEVFVRRVDGPPGAIPILLLHGWTSSADLTWWRVYERLGTLGPVIALDHRGHGRGIRSDERFTLEDAADDAAGVLRELGLGPAIVCGYSMGGPISMLLWQRHRDLVAGLVLEATALEWRASPAERWIWRTMALVERVMRSARSKSVVDRLLREVLEECPPLAEHRGWLQGEFRRGDPGAIADAGRAIGNYDARPFASLVDVPAAVVITTRDRLVRPSKQRDLADAIPNALRFDLHADHDACLVSIDDFADVTVQAVKAVSDQA
jgi:pimeloyl-ACP methyl ester carboxylesterase